MTGAGRGIGRATAVALAARGARVMATARTESELQSLAEEAQVEYVVGSVADPAACARIVAETEARLGPVEILVNNAGMVSAAEREVWAQDPAVWHETMAVNLHGPFELTRLVAGGMVERRYGRIVFVSSTAGEVGGAGLSAYCAAKHGVLGLMRAAAQDVGPYGVTCNAVLPGWTETRMAEESIERRVARGAPSAAEVRAEAVSAYPPGRMLTPEEIAATIVFLASEEASGISAEAVTVALGGLW